MSAAAPSEVGYIERVIPRDELIYRRSLSFHLDRSNRAPLRNCRGCTLMSQFPTSLIYLELPCRRFNKKCLVLACKQRYPCHLGWGLCTCSAVVVHCLSTHIDPHPSGLLFGGGASAARRQHDWTSYVRAIFNCYQVIKYYVPWKCRLSPRCNCNIEFRSFSFSLTYGSMRLYIYNLLTTSSAQFLTPQSFMIEVSEQLRRPLEICCFALPNVTWTYYFQVLCVWFLADWKL